MNAERFDAAVIGAGPAGSAAAIALARAGARTALIEFKPFPRAKVCGEFVSPSATAFLERLLPPARLRELDARTVDRFVLEHGDRHAAFTMPSPAWVLSRRTLDDSLVETAKREGVAVLQPASVRHAEHRDDDATLHIETDGTSITLRTSLVVHADGSGRFAPTRARERHRTPSRSGVVGLKCHLDPPVGDRIEGVRIRACRGAYVGSVGIEHGGATVALVARSELVKRTQAIAGPIRTAGGDTLLQRLAPTLDPALRSTPWLTTGVAGSRFRVTAHPRAILAGNAAAAVEPVGGEGIGLALFAGCTIADILRDAPRPWTLASLAAAQREYACRYRARLRFRRPACRLAAAVLERPALVNASWPLLAAPLAGTRIIASWYRLSGKPAHSST